MPVFINAFMLILVKNEEIKLKFKKAQPEYSEFKFFIDSKSRLLKLKMKTQLISFVAKGCQSTRLEIVELIIL